MSFLLEPHATLILILMTEISKICCKNNRYSIAAPKCETIATQLDWIFLNILLETDGSILERSIYSQAKTG